MSNIILHADDLLNTAHKMEDAANKIDGALRNLNVIMSDLDTVWSDENSKKYLARYDELKEKFPAFKMAIHSYSTFLNKVVETYQKDFKEHVSKSVE